MANMPHRTNHPVLMGPVLMGLIVAAVYATAAHSAPIADSADTAGVGKQLVPVTAAAHPSISDPVAEKSETSVLSSLARALSAPLSPNLTEQAIKDNGDKLASNKMNLRDMAMQALEKNLSIRRKGIINDVSKQALAQAEALFSPVLSLSIDSSLQHTRSRNVYDYKFKKALVTCPAGVGVVGNWCMDVPDSSPIDVIYNGPRAATYEYKAIEASTASLNDTVTHNFAGSLLQRLPWGQEVTLNLRNRYNDTHYVINAGNPGMMSLPYGKPWTAGFGFQTTVPLPFTRTFGVGYESNLANVLADQATKERELEVKVVLNNTLLKVDTDYWALVEAAMRIEVTERMVKAAGELRAHTKRLFDTGLVKESDWAQVEARVASIEGEYAQSVQNYIVIANEIRDTLNVTGRTALIPVGYASLLDQKEALSEDPMAVRDNPLYRQAESRIFSATATREARDRQTNPDVRASVSVQLNQSDAVFGYKTLENAYTHIFTPDSTTKTLGVTYLTTIGERASRAALAQAEAGVDSQMLRKESTELSLETDLRDARISLSSARARVDITRRAKEYAQMVYDRAREHQASRQATEYEITEKLIKLLGTEKSYIQARVAVKQAEARALSATGVLAERFGERTAQTDFDRDRIAELKSRGLVSHFTTEDVAR